MDYNTVYPHTSRSTSIGPCGLHTAVRFDSLLQQNRGVSGVEVERAAAAPVRSSLLSGRLLYFPHSALSTSFKSEGRSLEVKSQRVGGSDCREGDDCEVEVEARAMARRSL